MVLSTLQQVLGKPELSDSWWRGCNGYTHWLGVSRPFTLLFTAISFDFLDLTIMVSGS